MPLCEVLQIENYINIPLIWKTKSRHTLWRIQQSQDLQLHFQQQNGLLRNLLSFLSKMMKKLFLKVNELKKINFPVDTNLKSVQNYKIRQSTLKEETFAARKFLHFAGINFREWVIFWKFYKFAKRSFSEYCHA